MNMKKILVFFLIIIICLPVFTNGQKERKQENSLFQNEIAIDFKELEKIATTGAIAFIVVTTVFSGGTTLAIPIVATTSIKLASDFAAAMIGPSITYIIYEVGRDTLRYFFSMECIEIKEGEFIWVDEDLIKPGNRIRNDFGIESFTVQYPTKDEKFFLTIRVVDWKYIKSVEYFPKLHSKNSELENISDVSLEQVLLKQALQ